MAIMDEVDFRIASFHVQTVGTPSPEKCVKMISTNSLQNTQHHFQCTISSSESH